MAAPTEVRRITSYRPSSCATAANTTCWRDATSGAPTAAASAGSAARTAAPSTGPSARGAPLAACRLYPAVLRPFQGTDIAARRPLPRQNEAHPAARALLPTLCLQGSHARFWPALHPRNRFCFASLCGAVCFLVAVRTFHPTPRLFAVRSYVSTTHVSKPSITH